MDWLHQYKEKYIDTGSIKPLTDTITALFFFSYAVAWPQVYPFHIYCFSSVRDPVNHLQYVSGRDTYVLSHKPIIWH